MAKMFYTMDEVCSKLEKTPEEITQMVSSGQIQEFRDRDRLMFKAEQIDMLAGDEDTGEVKLDLETGAGLSGSGLSLEDESSIGLADSREGTGISVFDTDHGLDESEQTQVGDAEEELTLDAVGSGSGLLDLTRESDDTSLGAALLEEVYSGEDNIEMPANASGLFDAAPEAPQAGGGVAVAMPMLVETYDGAGSGLGIGLMVGALAALICLAIIVIVGVSGGTAGLATTFAGNIWMWAGGLLGVTIVLGLIGLFFGKASE
jgi:hypothetical protein